MNPGNLPATHARERLAASCIKPPTKWHPDPWFWKGEKIRVRIEINYPDENGHQNAMHFRRDAFMFSAQGQASISFSSVLCLSRRRQIASGFVHTSFFYCLASIKRNLIFPRGHPRIRYGLLSRGKHNQLAGEGARGGHQLRQRCQEQPTSNGDDGRTEDGGSLFQ